MVMLLHTLLALMGLRQGDCLFLSFLFRYGLVKEGLKIPYPTLFAESLFFVF